MNNIWRYYSHVFRGAWHLSLNLIGFEGMPMLSRTLVIWAATTLAIYVVPWVGILRDPSSVPTAEGEISLFLAALVAIIVVFLSAFLLSVFIVPFHIDKELRQDLTKIEGAISDAVNAESTLQKLSDLYHEGRRLYCEYDEPAAWEGKMVDWAECVESILKAEFSVSALHQFRRPGSNCSYRTDWEWKPYSVDRDINLKGKFSNRFTALDDLLMDNHHPHIGDKSALAEISGKIRQRTTSVVRKSD